MKLDDLLEPIPIIALAYLIYLDDCLIQVRDYPVDFMAVLRVHADAV